MSNEVQAALLGSAVTIFIFGISQIIDLLMKKRKSRTQIITLKNELIVNLEICTTLLDSADVPRTTGFEFLTSGWESLDKSVIYLKGIPGEKIIELYSKIKIYELLANRREKILQADKYPNMDKVINMERDEMIKIVQKIREKIEDILQIFPVYK